MLLIFAQSSFAIKIDKGVSADLYKDTVKWMRVDTTSIWYQRQINKARKVVCGFNKIDTTYIEPQR